MKISIAALFMLASIVLGRMSIALAQESNVQPELNLSQAIAEALKGNPEIQVAKRKVESVRARAGQATYLEDPEVNFEAWGVPLNHPVRFRSSNPIIIGLRQKLPFFGKRGLQGEVAAQEVRMAEEELRAKELEIVARVKSAYAELFMADRNVEIYKELLELVTQTSTAADSLYRVGRAPQQDLIKALLERTDLLNKLTWAERDVSTAKAKLNMLLNRPPTAAVGKPVELTAGSLSLAFTDLEKLAMEQRPEIRAWEASIRRFEKAVELAEKNRKFPDFMVGLGYWVAPDESPRHMYSPMVTLTLPFSPWTKGKHDYEVEEALAERRMAQSNLEAMKNTARFEIADLFAKVEAGWKSVSLHRDGLLPQADQSYQAALVGYQSGGVNFITLLDAQRSIRDVRMGYYKALVEYEQALADLERAVGKELR